MREKECRENLAFVLRCGGGREHRRPRRRENEDGLMNDWTAFGRVDADGTVYVRTAEGERVIGSWQAGSPEEALAFYQRKFEALNTEITLLEQRVTTTDLSPGQARATIERLRGAVTEAHAIAELGQLQARLEALSGKVDHRQEEV